MTDITRTRSPSFYLALRVNAVFSATCGLILLMASTRVAGWLGMDPSPWVPALGGGLLVFAARLEQLWRRGLIPKIEAWSIVAGDLGWVVFSLILLFAVEPPFSQTGRGLIAITGTVVLLLAVQQARGLRQAPADTSSAGSTA